MVEKGNSLGCGITFNYGICGVADAWGHESLCKTCMQKLRVRWDEEDRNNIELQNQLKGGNNK